MTDDWLAGRAISLGDDPWTLPGPKQKGGAPSLADLDARISSARILVLGETNHFIAEKTDFRLSWLRWLRVESSSRDRPIIIGEELGWADGRRVAAYLRRGDERELDEAATFGGRAHVRTDRNDAPRGVFAGSLADYPYAAMRRAHGRFYAGLRNLGPVDFFGFDVDVPGAGYHALLDEQDSATKAGLPHAFFDELARVPGESISEEADRLEHLLQRYSGRAGYPLIETDLEAMHDSLRYRLLADQAEDYEATRPAMAWREESMKRRVASVLSGALGTVQEDALIVLLGHAFHQAKDDAGIAGQGVGPGGGGTPSLGHWLNREQMIETAAIWLLYGAGRDSQPLKDLPNEFAYPEDSVNGVLGQREEALVVPLGADCPWGSRSGVGHLYNLVAEVDLCGEADAVHFLPVVTPLDQC